STLEANHDVGLLGQPVDDFALSLVPPLGTNHDHIGHEAAFLRVASARDSLEATKACPAFGASPDKGSHPSRQGEAAATERSVSTPPTCFGGLYSPLAAAPRYPQRMFWLSPRQSRGNIAAATTLVPPHGAAISPPHGKRQGVAALKQSDHHV